MNSLKLIVVLLLSSFLLACASSEGDIGQVTNFKYDKQEQIYLNTGDYVKLITLYKDRLLKEDVITTRLKMIEAYINMDDIESAEFNLNYLGQSTAYQSHIDYLFALVNYEKQYFGAAAIYAKKAVEINDNYPEAENLLGLIYASLGQYEQARHYFYLARQHLADDIKIKNNLAMIDILEGNYQQAIYRLEPLVLNGNRDDQVLANLGLSYAKTGQYDAFVSLYSDRSNEAELSQAFQVLQQAKGNVRVSRSNVNDVPQHIKEG